MVMKDSEYLAIRSQLWEDFQKLRNWRDLILKIEGIEWQAELAKRIRYELIPLVKSRNEYQRAVRMFKEFHQEYLEIKYGN